MEKTPGLVAVTKFVRPGSAVYASYINYMDRDEAVHGGEIHPDYSAYSENYMGNPEKTTGLFSMDYDRLSEDTAQIYKQQFRQAQENGSLLWQTVLSFDNQWLEELEIYDPTSQTLDESRVRGMTRVFMKTLLDKEQLTLASWTAAVHYNTDNIHVHVAIVDPVGQRERVPDGKYAGEPKGTWGIRSLRAAKSAAVNELLDLDQVMKQLNELIRQSIVKSLREQGGEEMVLQDDLNFLEEWGIQAIGKKQFDVMLAFAREYGEWNDFFCDYKWQKLGTAAAYYGYHFRAHDSLEDVRATLYIFDQMQHSNKRELFEDYFWEDSEDEFDEEEEW